MYALILIICMYMYMNVWVGGLGSLLSRGGGGMCVFFLCVYIISGVWVGERGGSLRAHACAYDDTTNSDS